MRKIKFYFLWSILAFTYQTNGNAQIVAQFTFDEATGEGKITETISTDSYQVENYQSFPERINGVAGNALRLDGYSTWVVMSNFVIPDVIDKMTVELWYATESFNAEDAGLIHQKSGTNGFAISVDPYGKMIVEFYAQGQYYAIRTTQKIEKYRWNHIVFLIDLPKKKAELFVNGTKWGEKITDDHTQIDLNNSLTYIGRSNRSNSFDGFPLTAANGAIDELTFYNIIIPDSTIQNNYNQFAHKTVSLDIDPNIRHNNDDHRPRYHPMPNTSWTNEPYGFTYFQNKYHLFFQKNPNAPILNFMHWGHLSSPDLVNWKEEKIVLAPTEGFASKGTWSGTTFLDKNDEPVIAYTGVNGAIAAIGLAYPRDSTLNDWSLYKDNPIIPAAPSNVNHLDFRDPYVWKEGESYYMVVGSGLQNKGGGVLFTYTSDDLINWINVPPIYKNTDASKAGVFWEMPYFNKINAEDYLLVVTPQFNSKPAETIYWMGSFDGQLFTPYDLEPKRFEHITRHLLSPAIGLDEESRLTYCGIIPDDRDVALQIESGWRHIFSIPRLLVVNEDGVSLNHLPHPNLCRARRHEVSVENRTITSGTTFNLPEYQGIQSELYFKLYTPDAEEFNIHVFKNEASTQLTSVTFDKIENSIGINRILSSTAQTVENIREDSYDFLSDTIEISIFLDHSVIEVFVDNSVVMSARAYPSKGSQLIDIVTGSKSKIEVLEFRAWDIVDKEVRSEALQCSELSTSTAKIETADYIEVFPNPSSHRLTIKELPSISQVTLYDTTGREYTSRVEYDQIDISALTKGLYTGVVQYKKKIIYFKFVKI